MKPNEFVLGIYTTLTAPHNAHYDHPAVNNSISIGSINSHYKVNQLNSFLCLWIRLRMQTKSWNKKYHISQACIMLRHCLALLFLVRSIHTAYEHYDIVPFQNKPFTAKEKLDIKVSQFIIECDIVLISVFFYLSFALSPVHIRIYVQLR